MRKVTDTAPKASKVAQHEVRLLGGRSRYLYFAPDSDSTTSVAGWAGRSVAPDRETCHALPEWIISSPVSKEHDSAGGPTLLRTSILSVFVPSCKAFAMSCVSTSFQGRPSWLVHA